MSAQGDAADINSIHLFLDRLRGETDSVELLVNAIDLLTPGYLSFLKTDLPKVLDHLSNEVLGKEEVIGPGLRGNPRWDKTTIGRLTGSIRPGYFYSRVAHKHFILPENSLLRWLVDAISKGVQAIERSVGHERLHASLRDAKLACDAAANHHWFADIPVPLFLTSEMIMAARRQKQRGYRNASALAERRFRITNSKNRWDEILSFLAVNWLEPVSEDDLFELYTLVVVLDVLSIDLGFGEPVEYGLVSGKRQAVAVFESRGRKVEVYFDQSPATAIGIRDRYSRAISSHHGISGSPRRPDVLIRLRSRDRERIVLIDAKKTTDGKYKSDSLYKGFGYAYDFESLWPEGYIGPRVIILFPSGVNYAGDFSDQIIALSGSDRSQIVNALEYALIR